MKKFAAFVLLCLWLPVSIYALQPELSNGGFTTGSFTIDSRLSGLGLDSGVQAAEINQAQESMSLRTPEDDVLAEPADANDKRLAARTSGQRTAVANSEIPKPRYLSVEDMAPEVSRAKKTMLEFRDGDKGLRAVLIQPQNLDEFLAAIDTAELVNIVEAELE